jgi:glycosyltransferase involved in cell wall biosynthesis
VRIYFLTQEHPSVGKSGGIGSYLSVITPALAARGHEVHVFVLAGDRVLDERTGDVRLHVRPPRPLPFLHGKGYLSITSMRIATARAATRALAEADRPDVIESPEWMAQSLLLDRSLRKRTVVHLHTSVGLIARYSGGAGKDARLADLLETRTIRRAAAVTSPSQLLLDVEIERGNTETSKTRVIRMPMDLERWSFGRDRTTERSLLVVGRVEHRKGLDVLVKAMSSLPTSVRDSKVIAVGRSSGLIRGRPYLEWLRSYAEEKKVALEHREHVDRDALPGVYAGARALVVPSRFDSFSMVALEAMASGTPVICSSTCGIAELIGDTGAGNVVPSEDPAALRDALVPYLEDPELAAKAGALARAVAEAEADPGLIARQRENLFEDVAQRASRKKANG